MRRARMDYAGFSSLEKAVAEIGRFILNDASTLARLEKLKDVPTDRKRRALAYAAVSVYQLAPEEFGLSNDDAPPGMRVTSDLGERGSPWMYDQAAA